jgi:methionyl-tRNA formyltransferase
MMRMILMGTGPFAVPSFEAILAAKHEVVCVVTRPIAGGNGKQPLPPSPVRSWAQERRLPIRDPQSINDAAEVDWLRSTRTDLLVVCDYGQILSREALSTTRLGGINLHGSLLPRHRGAAPVQWSILSGDQTAGVSVIHMTPALDAGPILCVRSTEIGTDEDAGQLEVRLSTIGVAATLESIAILTRCNENSELAATELAGTLQTPELATRAPRLSKKDGELNFHYQVRWIDRQIRGLQPWPGVFSNLIFPDTKSIRVIIHRARPIEFDAESAAAVHRLGAKVGQVLFGSDLQTIRESVPTLDIGHMAVVAQDGLLAIDELQPSGKRSMIAEEFLRGHSRFPTMRFQSDTQQQPLLERMMSLKLGS